MLIIAVNNLEYPVGKFPEVPLPTANFSTSAHERLPKTTWYDVIGIQVHHIML